MRRFFSSTSACGRPVSSAMRRAMRVAPLAVEARAGDAARRRSPRRRRPRRPRARPPATSASVALEQAVVLRDVGEGRQEQRVRQVVERREDDALQVHRARDQDQPRERDAGALQLVGHRRAARRAVALAGEIDRRAPALVARQPDAHHLGQRGDVAVDREHLLARLGARRRRPAGVRRIDEDQVEVLEPAVRVVGDGVRRHRHAAVVGRDDALRAERAEVQPDRRRARAAVEGEAHRAACARRRPSARSSSPSPRPAARRGRRRSLRRRPAGRRPGRCSRASLPPELDRARALGRGLARRACRRARASSCRLPWYRRWARERRP